MCGHDACSSSLPLPIPLSKVKCDAPKRIAEGVLFICIKTSVLALEYEGLDFSVLVDMLAGPY